MPEWIRVDMDPSPVRRGERLRVRWEAGPRGRDFELRLALVVHHETLVRPWGGDSRTALERQVHVIHDRAAVEGVAGAPWLRVPGEAPYSYPGKVLGFFWGIALAPVGVSADRLHGWLALRVLP